MDSQGQGRNGGFDWKTGGGLVTQIYDDTKYGLMSTRFLSTMKYGLKLIGLRRQRSPGLFAKLDQRNEI